LHRAAQALCSSEQIAAVKEGLVSVGVAIMESDVAITLFSLREKSLPSYCACYDGELAKMMALGSRQKLTPRRDCDITSLIVDASFSSVFDSYCLLRVSEKMTSDSTQRRIFRDGSIHVAI
jgi:hypothetical protein